MAKSLTSLATSINAGQDAARGLLCAGHHRIHSSHSLRHHHRQHGINLRSSRPLAPASRSHSAPWSSSAHQQRVGSLLHTSAPVLVDLTPSDVSAVIRAEEYTSEAELTSGAVHHFDRNVLPCNSPIEDTFNEAALIHRKDSMIFGVFDGHAGPMLAKVRSNNVARLAMQVLIFSYFSGAS